jgi:hypothetical protein
MVRSVDFSNYDAPSGEWHLLKALNPNNWVESRKLARERKSSQAELLPEPLFGDLFRLLTPRFRIQDSRFGRSLEDDEISER